MIDGLLAKHIRLDQGVGWTFNHAVVPAGLDKPAAESGLTGTEVAGEGDDGTGLERGSQLPGKGDGFSG